MDSNHGPPVYNALRPIPEDSFAEGEAEMEGGMFYIN